MTFSIKPQPGAQTDFIKMMDDVPLVFYGGAAGGGKSFALLMDCLKYIDCPHFYGVYFRKTMKQLERTLWPEAKDLFMPFLIDPTVKNKNGSVKYLGKAQIKEQAKTIVFPSGAKVEFSYLDRDADAQENWQGAQLTAAYFDETTHFTEYCFNYIRTRMRSKSKYKSFIRCSLNPDPNSFVLKYLGLFIGEDGFPIKSLTGNTAYFINDKGDLITSFDRNELKEKYPNKKPRQYTFVPSSLSDNPALLETNPEYAEDLEANDPANAAMLLLGNWKYKPAANGMFDKSTIVVLDKSGVPHKCRYIRAWDKAASKPAKEGGNSKQLDPDYTASIMFAKDSNGFLYILGNYKRDQQNKQRARFRELPAQRDVMIEEQAIFDGIETVIYLPVDPAQAGAVEFQESAKKLQAKGFIVKRDPTPSNRSKRLRFESFASACYTGVIYWIKESFDPEIWDYMMMELENFDGDKNGGYHDDLVDTFSTAYAATLKEKAHRAVSIPDSSSAYTLKKQAGLYTK